MSEIDGTRDYFSKEMKLFESDTRETQELIAKHALLWVAKEVWPDEFAQGKFDFLRNEIIGLYDVHARNKDDGTRIRGKVLSAPQICLHALAGFAVAALRTETPFRNKMAAGKAQTQVARWSGVKDASLQKWTPAMGDVKAHGAAIKEAEEATGILYQIQKIMRVDMPIEEIKNRVIAQRKSISAKIDF